jgi:hypothetical protein
MSIYDAFASQHPFFMTVSGLSEMLGAGAVTRTFPPREPSPPRLEIDSFILVNRTPKRPMTVQEMSKFTRAVAPNLEGRFSVDSSKEMR